MIVFVGGGEDGVCGWGCILQMCGHVHAIMRLS